MGQASITVDILAKIKGWQEELAKLKAAAGKIDLGSDFGKSLEKGIKDLESRITSMGRNVTRLLTSESSIDNFTDKVNNIDLAFQNLGNHLAGVSFENLNPAYVTELLKELHTELSATAAELDNLKLLDFSKAIDGATTLKSALERLGQDPATVNFKEVPEILKSGIDAAKTTIDEATTKLGELNAKLAETKALSAEIGKTPILAVNDLHAKILEIVGLQSDYGFGALNTLAINQWIVNLRALLLAAGEDLSDDSNAVNLALQKIADSKTKEEVQLNLVALKTLISKEGKINVTDIGLGSGDLKATINSFIHNDLAKLDLAKVALENKLRDMAVPQEIIDKIIPNFTKAVSLGKWAEGLRSMEELLELYRQTILDKSREIQLAKLTLETEINSTKSTRGKAEYTLSMALRALDTEYPALILELRTKNAALEERVAALEKLLLARMGELVGKTAGTGAAVSDAALQQLLNNADAARMYKTELELVQAREQMIGKIQGVVQRWFSIYAVVRMVTNAIKSVISTTKELDATITEIAIVTKMDHSDLWGQMEQYTELARKYAASISGVYKVSQLYYQQGLGKEDVMALTEQTLKMARISGLDYAEATDYMTNAVRSFKMEMTDAQTVVDVYSSVAASSATNVTELATAMSKTASSALAVGSSFLNTTAMMAVMIEATRESAENIGSAMKSIISRYGELKENKTGIDEEGEEYSLNKVDKALQSVGLSIHDAKGEFRDFDDVIMELSEKWDTIDKNTQRYIATVMAGNRQQSRFLALVSSYDRLKELSEEAADSEDAAQLQFLKTLDSVDAKTQQLQTSLLSLYVDSGLENMYKGILDIANNIILSFTLMPTLFNLPIPAITKFGMTFLSIASLVTNAFAMLKAHFSNKVKALNAESTADSQVSALTRVLIETSALALIAAVMAETVLMHREMEQQKTIITAEEAAKRVAAALQAAAGIVPMPTTGGGAKGKGITKGLMLGGMALSLAGTTLSGIGDNMKAKTDDERKTKGAFTGGGSLLQGVGLGMTFGGTKGAIIGGAIGGLIGVFQYLDIATETTSEKIKRLDEEVSESNNERIKAQDSLKTLTEYKKKWDEASKTKNLDAEHLLEWTDLNNEIVETYPELLGYIDAEGNAVANLGAAYDDLLASKKDAYEDSLFDNITDNLESMSDMQVTLQKTASAAVGSTFKKERTLTLLGHNIYASDIFSSPNLMNDKQRASKAEETINEILGYMTDSNGNFELFKEMVQSNTGYSWDDWVTGNVHLYSATGVEFTDDNVKKVYAKVFGNLNDNFTQYFERIDKYVENLLITLSNHFGEGMDFTRYSVLLNLMTDALMQEWESYKASAIAEGGSVTDAFEAFWKDLPDLIASHNKQIMERASGSKSVLLSADDIFSNRDLFSSHLLLNLDQYIDSDVYSVFTRDLITSMVDYAKEMEQKAIDRLDIILDLALDDEIDFSGFESDLNTMKSVITDIPIQYLDVYTDLIGGILLSSQYTPEHRAQVASSLANAYQTIGVSALDEDLMKKAYSLLGNMDISSLYSITTTEQELSKLGLDIDFSSLTQYLIPNLNTEINTYLDLLTAGFTSINDALSKAAKGLNFADTVLMIEELGLAWEDFERRGDKFYIKDPSKISKRYSNRNTGYEKELDAEIKERTDLYSGLVGPHTVSGIKINTREALEGKFNNDLFSLADYLVYSEGTGASIGEENLISPMTVKSDKTGNVFVLRSRDDVERFQLYEGINFIKSEYLYGDSVGRNPMELYDDKFYEYISFDKYGEGKYSPEAYLHKASQFDTDVFKHLIDDLNDENTAKIYYRMFLPYLEARGLTFEKLKDGIDEAELAAIDEMNTEIWALESDITFDLQTDIFDKALTGTQAGKLLDAWKEVLISRFDLQEEEFALLKTDVMAYVDDENPDKGDFITYISQRTKDVVSGAVSAEEAAEKALLASYSLNAGMTEEFIKIVMGEAFSGLDETTITNYKKAVETGNITELPAEYFGEWYSDIYGLALSNLKDIYDNIAEAYGTNKYIVATEKNKALLDSLTSEGLLTDLGDGIYQVVANNYEAIKSSILNSTEDDASKAEQLARLFESEYRDKLSPISSILDADGVSYDAALKFAESLGRNATEAEKVMEDYHFKLNTITGKYEATSQTYTAIRSRIRELESQPDADQEELNKLRAMVDDLEKQEKRKTNAAAFKDIFSNYDDVTTDMIAALATAMQITYDSAKAQFFKDNGDGTFRLNMNQLSYLLAYGKIALGEAVYNDLLDYVAEIYDDGLTAISDAGSFISHGTDKASDMLKFVTDFNKKNDTNYSISDMFVWDDILESYTLKPEYLQQYMESQRKALRELGFDETFIEKYINQLVKEIKKNIDIASFYSAENRGRNSLARRKLEASMKASLTAQTQFQSENIADYTNISIPDSFARRKSAEWGVAQAKKHNEELLETINILVLSDLATLEAGGEAAIAVMRKYSADGELTVELIEQAYKARLTGISNVMDALSDLLKNSVVDATTKAILEKIPGFQITADGVIYSVGNLVDAYTELYKQMKETNVATIGELNSAYAQVLTANELGDIDAIEVLNNAMGMTYDALAQMLTKYGMSLETMMLQPDAYGITQIGGGKVQISDFTKFASTMGWASDSEEYISAFKQYNDSLILYNKHISDEIKGEFDTMATAKPGETFNLTRMVSEYGESALNDIAKEYGAYIKDGILHTSELTDMKGLLTKFGEKMVADGSITEAELGATLDQLGKQSSIDLAEAYKDIITNYGSITIETIRKYAEARKISYDAAKQELGLSRLNAETQQWEDVGANGDGTYKIDASHLKDLLALGKEELGETVYNNLLEEMANIQDNALKSVNNAVSLATSGTNNLADMIKFGNAFREFTGQEDVTNADLFQYSESLGQFVLSSKYLYTYLQKLGQELIKLGMSQEDVAEYILTQGLKVVLANLDIQGYLNSAERGAGSDASNKIRDLIKQILTMKKGGKDINDSLIDYYLNRIERGGWSAVNAIKALKGSEATDEDFSAAYNAGMNRINQAIEDTEKGIGEIISKDTAKILATVKGYGLRELANGLYVITAVGDMIGAYVAIYQLMKETAGRTTADLNNLYVKLATLMDQKNIDTRDTLTNAFDMSYEDFNALLSKYNPYVWLEDILTSADKMLEYGIERTGFGTINITDFDSFATKMGWDTNSIEFLEYYSQYVDGLIEHSDKNTEKYLQERAYEQAKAISEAKPGDKVNVTYLLKVFGKDFVNKIFELYGAQVKEGFIELAAGTDIPSIIASIIQVAESTGQMIPEKLAELKDTLADFLENIINLIKSGISGTLSNVEALDLQNWANERGINVLFIETAEGLQLTAESMALVYDEMRQIDSLQAHSLLNNIKESNNNYKTLSGTLKEVAEIEKRTASTNPLVAAAKAKAQKLYGAGGGTVPLEFEARPHITLDDGSVATVLSQSFGNGLVEVLVTPILPDGTMLSEGALGNYAEQFANGEITLETKLVGEDGKELGYTFKDIYMGTFDTAEAAEAAAIAYHNYHDAIMSAADAMNNLNAKEKAQHNLLKDLVREHLLTADSMNFMSNSLPEGMLAAVNAWENTAQGIDTLTAAEKNGYIGVLDFYNIVETASSLMEAAGKDFEISEKNAAQLMEAAGNHLKIVDGKLTVDISNTGLDIIGDVGTLKSNLKSGIDELAKAQIEMLDAEIKVLEILAAMELIGDVDVNGNGISFEIDDLFEFDNAGTRVFSSQFKDYLTSLLSIAETTPAVEEALKSIRLGSKSMYELIYSDDWGDWLAAGFTELSLSQFLLTLTTMDWNEADILRLVAEVLSGLKIGVSVELDHGLYVFTLTGETFSFDWNNKETMAAAKGATEQFYNGRFKNEQEALTTLAEEYLTGKSLEDGHELTWEEKWKAKVTLALGSGEVDIKFDKDKNEWTARYGGLTFTGASDEIVREAIGQAMGYEEEGYTFDYDAGTGKVRGKMSIGSKEMYIEHTDDGNTIYTASANGEKYTGPSLENALAFLASLGEANAADAGKTYHTESGEVWNIYTDAETNLTYTAQEGKNLWIYKGKPFESYDALVNYLHFTTKAQNGTYTDETKMDVKFEGGVVTMHYDDTTGEITYTINGQECGDEAAVEAYLKALREPSHTINASDGSINYSLLGLKVNVKYDSTAGLLYTMTFADGGVVTAADEESLKAAIAVHTKPQGGTVTGEEKGINYELSYKGKVTVKVVESKVTEGDDTEGSLQTALNTYTSEHPVETTVTAEASAVDVKLAEGATVKVDSGEDGLKLNPDPESVTGNVNTVTLTADNVNVDSVGEQIVTALQNYLNSNPVTPKLSNDSKEQTIVSTILDIILGLGLSEAITSIRQLGIEAEIASGHVSKMGELAGGAETEVLNLGTAATAAAEALDKISLRNNGGTDGENGGENTEGLATNPLDTIASSLENISAEPFTAIVNALGLIKTDKIEAIAKAQNNIKSDNIEAVKSAANTISPVNALAARGAINNIDPSKAEAAKAALGNITVLSQHMTADAVVTIHIAKGSAAGNMGAFAKGNTAMAGGTRTLVGELGPELVVSNGRYFVVGQAGAEFVDLDKDAIVFNHKLTERLMNLGGIGSRGKPFTNEQNAISYAKGNAGPAKADGDDDKFDWTYTYQLSTNTPGGSTNGHVWLAPAVLLDLPAAAKGTGPAMAGASAALAALKKLRAMWKSLLDASVQDLAAKGGGGGGGGGGGDPAAFIKDLERWYDWLQHIAKLEKDINYYEAERNRISSEWAPNGRKYYESQKNTLGALRELLAVQNSLTKSLEAYFEKRRKELNEQSAFSALYGFSESGQLYYKDVYADGKSAFEWLSDLAGRDAATGEANYTAKEQYDKLVEAGFGFAMKYDSSGNEIKLEGDDWYSTAVLAFWDKIDADKEEMQSLYDAIQEGYVTLEDLLQQLNEILREMRDNQMDLELKVYDAIVDIRERAIDELKDTKEAINDLNSKFIDGLSKALLNELNMYSNAESRESLDKLRNKRDILLRSGGSAALIASLNEEIEDQEKSVYFDKLQEEIDAILAASDKLIEKLDAQINLETEILEYLKKYGLLWAEVTDIMGKSPEEIARFISENDSNYWDQSPVAHADALNQLLFLSEQWVSFRDDGTALANNVDLIARTLTGDGDHNPGEDDNPPDGGSNPPGGSDNPPSLPLQPSKTISQWVSDGADGCHPVYSDGTKGKTQAHVKDSGTEDNQGRKHFKCKRCGYDMGFIYAGGAEGMSNDSVQAGIEASRLRQLNLDAQELQEASTPTLLLSVDEGIKDFFGTVRSFFGFKPVAKATGGYVNHGVYELGERGTEAVLTASLTKVLRDNILSNKPNSLINLLQSYNDAYKGLSAGAYDSISNNSSNSTVIEKVDVNLNIDKLANDYDAKHAANTIMDEMLRIASRTSANNSVRR